MITFNKMILEDISFYNSVRNDCRDNLHNNSYYSIEQSINWFNATNPIFYVINLNNEKIGYFRTSNYSSDNKNIYIGADLEKSYRGKGLAYKAYIEFIPFIFKQYNLNKISLEVLETNQIAFNLYKKIGFKIEGVKREEVFRNGEYINSILMSILKKEWNNE